MDEDRPMTSCFDTMAAARPVMDAYLLDRRIALVNGTRRVVGHPHTVITGMLRGLMDSRVSFNAKKYREWSRSLMYPDGGRPDGETCRILADRMYGVIMDADVGMDAGGINVPGEWPDGRDHGGYMTRGSFVPVSVIATWASASMCMEGRRDAAAAWSVMLAGDTRLDNVMVRPGDDSRGMEDLILRRVSSMYFGIEQDGPDSDMMTVGDGGMATIRRSPFALASLAMGFLSDWRGMPMGFTSEYILSIGPMIVEPPHADMFMEPECDSWNPMVTIRAILYAHAMYRETYGTAYYMRFMAARDADRHRDGRSPV